MIYKFEKEQAVLEVKQSNYSQHVFLSIEENECQEKICLDVDQLYNLIGALHSIQTKIKKGGQNG